MLRFYDSLATLILDAIWLVWLRCRAGRPAICRAQDMSSRWMRSDA